MEIPTSFLNPANEYFQLLEIYEYEIYTIYYILVNKVKKEIFSNEDNLDVQNLSIIFVS
jgi:hypothetical protein